MQNLAKESVGRENEEVKSVFPKKETVTEAVKEKESSEMGKYSIHISSESPVVFRRGDTMEVIQPVPKAAVEMSREAEEKQRVEEKDRKESEETALRMEKAKRYAREIASGASWEALMEPKVVIGAGGMYVYLIFSDWIDCDEFMAISNALHKSDTELANRPSKEHCMLWIAYADLPTVLRHWYDFRLVVLEDLGC